MPDGRALVTGAGGFIASHLVEELLGAGYDVRGLFRYNSRSDAGSLAMLPPSVARNVEVVFGDLRDPDAVLAAAGGCGVIFHLGALIAIPYSYVHPRETVETNVLGSLNVFEAARRHQPRRVVHVSTSEVYGTARQVPIVEEHPLQGQSPYSASKIGADKLAEAYTRSFDVPIVTVRPFNAYGPRQSARAVIPTIVIQALASDAVRLGATWPTRDFTYARDTARGMTMAAETAGVVGEVINLGSGREISVGDLAGRILRLVGRDLPVVAEDVRLRPPESEVGQLLADSTRAADLLGWRSQVGLDEGLGRTIDWIRDNIDRFRPEVYTR